MDIVAILRKADVHINDFNMKVCGELSKQAPLQYIAMHIKYELTGIEATKEAVIKAVTDSQEKYCGVSSMLKKAIPVTWEISFNNTKVFNNKQEDFVMEA